ncbi:C2 domain-containing protein 5 [Liparis tanakae]|uniref:Lipase maturation factor n=1 Tax=Liparis tanakae TaxID=230148 RepID=A0A4Z2IPT4_9TELE|nr:C2 domain-containing protein 5 [Liparis tanakae]
MDSLTLFEDKLSRRSRNGMYDIILMLSQDREFPFFTLTSFPPGFLVHVGGVVSARSVKLLDRIHNPERQWSAAVLCLLELTEDVVGSPIPEPRQRSRLFRSHSESSDEVSELDLSHGKKDAFVLEMFTSVRVFRLSNANLTNQGLNKIFTDLCENLLKSFYFKLRSMIPCCLCQLNFTVTVTAVAMTFDKDQTQEKTADKPPPKGGSETEEQLQFPLELCADLSFANCQPTSKISGVPESANVSSRVSSLERCSPLPEGRSRSLRSNRSFGGSSVTVVKMTPLSFLPGTRIIKYLGIINMDNLLLEAGFLCILVAPLTLIRGSRGVREHDRVTFWLLRWLLFRLMFASGVVKLTSRCPTWWGLTGVCKSLSW